MNANTLRVDRRILYASVEFLILSLLTVLIPISVATDVKFFSSGFSEIPLTELSQEILLAISGILFAIRAWQRPESRGFLTLAAGMFLTMLIREMDAYFDRWVYHSFWVWPAVIVASGTVTYVAFRCRDSVWTPMSEFAGTKSQTFLTIGFVVLLVLSRTLGSGDLLWKHVMSKQVYDLTFKTALQEGLELFGYLLICYGSWLFPQKVVQVASEPNSMEESRENSAHAQPQDSQTVHGESVYRRS